MSDSRTAELLSCPFCGMEFHNEREMRLEELLRDLYATFDSFMDCADHCGHVDTCASSGRCWYEARMEELGAELA